VTGRNEKPKKPAGDRASSKTRSDRSSAEGEKCNKLEYRQKEAEFVGRVKTFEKEGGLLTRIGRTTPCQEPGKQSPNVGSAVPGGEAGHGQLLPLTRSDAKRTGMQANWEAARKGVSVG